MYLLKLKEFVSETASLDIEEYLLGFRNSEPDCSPTVGKLIQTASDRTNF